MRENDKKFSIVNIIYSILSSLFTIILCCICIVGCVKCFSKDGDTNYDVDEINPDWDTQ